MDSVHPYLFFDGDAAEALAFYAEVFETEPLGVVRFEEFAAEGMELADEDRDKIAHAAIALTDDVTLMLSDTVGPDAGVYVAGTNIYTYLEADTDEEAERLFTALSEGGRVEMPLMETDWADKYSSFIDKFGNGWMVGYTGDAEFRFDDDDEDEDEPDDE